MKPTLKSIFLRQRMAFLGTVFILGAALATAQDSDPIEKRSSDEAVTLNADTFAKLHAKLQVDKDAAWRSIPWELSLLKAQNLAAEKQRPIFIWAMDGHPCGCT